MNTVANALRRAVIRLRYHGWRQGAGSNGFNLREAIVGKRNGLVGEAELQALVVLAEAIGLPEGDLDAWNDAPYRTKEEVLKVLRRARRGCMAPSKSVPSPCAARRMADGEQEKGTDGASPAMVETPAEILEAGILEEATEGEQALGQPYGLVGDNAFFLGDERDRGDT